MECQVVRNRIFFDQTEQQQKQHKTKQTLYLQLITKNDSFQGKSVACVVLFASAQHVETESISRVLV